MTLIEILLKRAYTKPSKEKTSLISELNRYLIIGDVSNIIWGYVGFICMSSSSNNTLRIENNEIIPTTCMEMLFPSFAYMQNIKQIISIGNICLTVDIFENITILLSNRCKKKEVNVWCKLRRALRNGVELTVHAGEGFLFLDFKGKLFEIALSENDSKALKTFNTKKCISVETLYNYDPACAVRNRVKIKYESNEELILPV